MKDFEYVENKVKNMLSEKRYYHSVCTMNRAVEYAKLYGENVEKVRLTAIAHDIAKELSKEEKKDLKEKYNIKLDEMEDKDLALSHSKIGAAIAKYEFEFEEDMINAIAYHTTGRENMTLLDKIIFVADLTGEDRKYENTEEFYQTAITDLDLAVVKILKHTINHILEKNKKIHMETIKSYNYFMNK